MDGKTVAIFFILFANFCWVYAAPKIGGKSKSNNNNNQQNHSNPESQDAKKRLRQGLPQSIESSYDQYVDASIQEYTDNSSSSETYSIENEDSNEYENSYRYSSDEDQSSFSENPIDAPHKKTRPLAVGDTFTPHELIKICTKLLSKVKNPGEGKGFVSSERSAFELTDKLFEAFFMTFKRIVKLREIDIPGLDALQALALSGEPVNDLNAEEYSYIESPVVQRSRILRSGPLHCRYTLLRKRVEGAKKGRNTKNLKRRHQAARIKKNLGKNRNLIVNPGRRGIAKKNKTTALSRSDMKKKAAKAGHRKPSPKIGKKSVLTKRNKKSVHKTGKKNPELKKGSKTLRSTMNNKKSHESSKSNCRWQYGCENQFDLTTCELKKVCTKDPTAPFIAIKERDNEDTLTLRRFRKKVKIEVVDEEVEKILEIHILKFHPGNMYNENRIESLAEYFNNIILAKEGTSTTPLPLAGDNDDDSEHKGKSTEKMHVDLKIDASYSNGSSNVNENLTVESVSEDDDTQARRILGLIPRPYNVTGPPPRLQNKPQKPYYVFL